MAGHPWRRACVCVAPGIRVPLTISEGALELTDGSDCPHTGDLGNSMFCVSGDGNNRGDGYTGTHSYLSAGSFRVAVWLSVMQRFVM